MKSHVIATMLLIALLCVGIANAAVTFSDVSLGSATQERGETVSETVTVTSNTAGDVTLTITPDAGRTITFDDNSTVKVVNFATANSSQVITIKGFIPLNLDAVDGNMREVSFSSGTLSASGADTGSATIKMQAENSLTLYKVRVTVEGTTKTLDDGDKIKDIAVGSDIDIEIIGENTYSDNYDDGDMSDVEFTALIDDNDFDIDESDEIDIDTDERETINFDGLRVDEDVSDDTYELEICVDGTDDNGARHGECMSVDMVVERASHEVSIDSASLTRTVVDCEQPSTSVNVRFSNIGKKDEDNVAISVINSVLGISQTVDGIPLDESDGTSRTLTLNPKVDKPGTYTLDVIAFWEGSIESDRSSITLTVAECPKDEPKPNTTVVITPTQPVVTPPVAPTSPADDVPRVKVSSTEESAWTLPLLIVGILVVIVLIIVLLVVLFKPNAQ